MNIRWPEDARFKEVEQVYYACCYLVDRIEETHRSIYRGGQREQLKLYLDAAKDALKHENTELFEKEKAELARSFKELRIQLREITGR